MNKKLYRMQMLAGIITEDEYKKLNENQASDLINDGVVLYVSDDSKLAPGFIKPKGIGFIVYNAAIKDTPKSILSITGPLSKNREVRKIFMNNYGAIDTNYITSLLNGPNNWKAITSEDELNNFMSKYNKIYIINPNGNSSQLTTKYPNFTDFDIDIRDTNEWGFMEAYIEDVVDENDLDLNNRSDFDEAFDSALTRLQHDHPELDFDAIEANKELFF